MQVDWITVAAQIVNFLILVWLLQRFLYRPIVQAMERREKRIADRLHEADRKKQEAEAEAHAYREKQKELDERRDRLLAEARQTAEEERKAFERQARDDVEARKREWVRQLDAERETFLSELRRRSTEQFYTLARRALGDLAGAELEEQIATSFVRQLDDLDKHTADKMARACKRAEGRVRIQSRFELSANARRSITRALHERFGEGAHIDYETSDGVVCGIELNAGGQVLSWNLASYLDGFEQAVGEHVSQVLDHAEDHAKT